MLIVGLTGGIACGKTTVSTILVNQSHIDLVDCDKIAFDVVRKGTWGYKRVINAFKDHDILLPNGEIDREALGQLVFSNPAHRKKLNKATHFPIFLDILKRLFFLWLTCKRVVVIDVPLLFESRFYKVTKPNIVVACQRETQLQRLIDRDGLSVEAAEARINSQMPLERKVQLADIVIDNSGNSIEELTGRVDSVGRQLREKGNGVLHSLILSPIGFVIALGGCILSLHR